MSDLTIIRERYLRDALAVRLGGLAANLARIRSFAAHEANRESIESLLYESKFFIEWTAPDTEINTAAELAELQIRLACWERNLSKMWSDRSQRKQIAELAGSWSNRILQLSGLLEKASHE
jgi:hypothetical protein